jgi:hypothetical protein
MNLIIVRNRCFETLFILNVCNGTVTRPSRLETLKVKTKGKAIPITGCEGS